jgi:dynein heavy chain, axonemal
MFKFIAVIEHEMIEQNLQITNVSMRKVIEFYETQQTRHSVMLVGQTLSGKTTTWKLFKCASTTLHRQGDNDFCRVQVQ